MKRNTNCCIRQYSSFLHYVLREYIHGCGYFEMFIIFIKFLPIEKSYAFAFTRSCYAQWNELICVTKGFVFPVNSPTISMQHRTEKVMQMPNENQIAMNGSIEFHGQILTRSFNIFTIQKSDGRLFKNYGTKTHYKDFFPRSNY